MNIDVFKALFWISIQKVSRVLLGTIICFLILVGPTNLFLHIPMLGIIKIVGWIAFASAVIYLVVLFLMRQYWEAEPDDEGNLRTDMDNLDAVASFLKNEGIRCPGLALIVLALLGANTAASHTPILIMLIIGALLILVQMFTKTPQKVRPDI